MAAFSVFFSFSFFAVKLKKKSDNGGKKNYSPFISI